MFFMNMLIKLPLMSCQAKAEVKTRGVDGGHARVEEGGEEGAIEVVVLFLKITLVASV